MKIPDEVQKIIWKHLFTLNVVSKIPYQVLLREIRGEKWVYCEKTPFGDNPCLNCYAYKDTDFGNGIFCLNHMNNNEGTSIFRRINYLQFLRYCNCISRTNFFTQCRVGINSENDNCTFINKNDLYKYHLLFDSCTKYPSTIHSYKDNGIIIF
jgi:hypothetical protein